MHLKILHISQSCNPRHGGPIEAIRQQTIAHKKRGDVVEVLSLDSPNSDYLNSLGLKVYPCLSSWYDNIFPITLYRWLLLNHKSFDAVIINGIWGFHLLASWLVLAKSSVPYFVFPHGMLDPWFRYTFPLKHLKKTLLWSWSVYPVLRDADAVLFTCEKELSLARKSFKLYRCNEVVVKFGTSGIPFPSKNYSKMFIDKHPFLVDKQCFLFLGRVHPKKAPELLLYAIADLIQKNIWIDGNMVLVIAGPNDDKYACYLKKLAINLSITESVYWTGMISGDIKWGAFQFSDVFVLPSHQENFGIAVAESLSCSTPVLISHPVNISPIIDDNSAGFVDYDTIGGATNLLSTWIKYDDHLKMKMRQAARQCFESNFEIRHCVESISKSIYKSLEIRKLSMSSTKRQY